MQYCGNNRSNSSISGEHDREPQRTTTNINSTTKSTRMRIIQYTLNSIAMIVVYYFHYRPTLFEYLQICGETCVGSSNHS